MSHPFAGLEKYVQTGVRLGPLTTYRVGGPAEYFAEPPDEKILATLLQRAAETQIEVRLLGHGTNLLVGERGVQGLVIRLPRGGFLPLRQEGRRVLVPAGLSLPGLVKWSAQRGLSGMECLAGVPGTVGAALRMNAGGRHGEIGALVRSVGGLDLEGKPFEFPRAACRFAYRDSGLQDRIVTRCVMELEEGDSAASLDRIRQLIAEKSASQPLSKRSAGCVFKNPGQPGVPPAGKLIDLLGLKGKRIGGARISPVHANFLVCELGATAVDLTRLIRFIRQQVWMERGILLELEIATWGIRPEELLPLQALGA